MNRKRRNEIARMIDDQQMITNDELIERFGISVETVRRDLAYLEQQGILTRVYGGAVKKETLGQEPLYKSRENENNDEKKMIAVTAKQLINNNDIVFFDLGTTVEMVAKEISKNKKIHALTNALRTAVTLSENAGEVILTGGRIREGELSLSGSVAEINLSKYNINKAIIGAAGITDEGISDFIPEEAAFRAKVIQNASEVILVADYTKFGIRAMCKVCDISGIDILITDAKAPKEILKRIEKKGVRIIIAK